MISARKRIWGWFFFDWASQPYHTLLITFIFTPFMKDLLGDGSRAQAVWGYGIGAAGIVIALLAPLLGTIADRTGGRLRFIQLFSIFYVVGAWGLWYAVPGDFSLLFVLVSFAIGLIGMEFATIFTNAMLPDLASKEDIGRLSGSGWGFGYVGGVMSLVIMLGLFAEGSNGKTLIGIAPVFGLDPVLREGTRAVGPFTAIWYLVFMIPFFLWVREPVKPGVLSIPAAAATAWPALRESLGRLPGQKSLMAFLASSMFYRDALNGIYVFGGLYAAGVLGWEIRDVGIFGILAAVTGAVFAWLGGKADRRFGPRPVIFVNVTVLTLTAITVVTISRDSIFGLVVAPESRLPDIAFYICGALIGACGGALQAASRTMMVHQADPARMTEAFGLYALSGRATAFIAPLSIGIATSMSGSQQFGITPVIALFLLGLILLIWVRPNKNRRQA
ncbi:MAG: MFS transporter [Pseudorhodobacter sp.]